MPKLKENLNVVILVLTMISFLSGGLFWLDSRFAHASSVSKLKTKVSLNELRLMLNSARNDFFFFKKLHLSDPDNEEYKLQLKESEEHLSNIKSQILELKKKDD